ncbi:hypothetical protein [Methylobacterium segetis]|uniref:hypothetical protein n=1 Tax=Methylobacterium segetis TaxID=2488750 RepID=UPI0010456387|nr:hypothetical protein [Methylobacterium segetis]
MATETKAAFARRHRVNRSTIQKWEARGHLVMTADARVDIEASERLLSERPAVYRGGMAKGNVPAQTAARHQPAEASSDGNPFDIAVWRTVLYLLRPHADIVAAAVLEAGGSLEVAYAAARLAHSPFIEAAGLTLQAMRHPDFQGDEHDLRAPSGWLTEPNWQAYAEAAGVRFEPDALEQHLDANPVWNARFDDDPRRFQRDLALSDITGTGGSRG